jgi:hypothetical protein
MTAILTHLVNGSLEARPGNPPARPGSGPVPWLAATLSDRLLGSGTGTGSIPVAGATGFGGSRIFALLALAAAIAVVQCGCVSKSTADAQARAAYLAGRQEAMAQWQQETRGPGVMFVGPVNHPFVKWSDGLTLSQAIVRAGYSAPQDPANLVIRRGGEMIPFDPKRLLQGEDFPLAPGDIVELQP